MSDHRSTARPAPKVDPETLVLNAAPRRVVRFKRRLLIGIAAHRLRRGLRRDLAGVERPGRAARPRRRSFYNTESANQHRRAWPPCPAATGYVGRTPPTGPPLPGDLGRPILERQRQLGLTPAARWRTSAAAGGAAASCAAGTAGAEAGVFFQMANRAAPVSASGAGRSPAPRRPALPPTTDANRLTPPSRAGSEQPAPQARLPDAACRGEHL